MTELSIRESRLGNQSIYLTEQNLMMFGEDSPLTDDQRIAEARQIHQFIQRKRELTRLQASRKTAIQKQGRFQQLGTTVRGGGGEGGQRTNKWMIDLAQTEKTIRELDENAVSAINADLEEFRTKLGKVLQGIRATWDDPTGSIA